MLDVKEVKLYLNLKKDSKNNLQVFLTDDFCSPIAKLSIDTPEQVLNEDEFILKNYSENEDLAKILIEEEIVHPTGKNITIGHNSLPICKIFRDE